MRKHLYIIGFLVSFVASSQTKLPTSADHVFVPQDVIKNAQPTSFFSMVVGLQESEDVPLLNSDLPIIGPVDLEGEVLFVDFGIKASVKLKDWIAWRISYSAAVRAGTDVQSILFQGINSLTTFESLWQLRVWRTQKMTLSGTFGFNRIDGDFVDIAGYIESIRDGIPDPSVTRKVRSLTGEVGLLGSYAVNSVIGILFEGEVEIGDHVGVETARVFWSGRLGVDFNFNERYNFPLGIAVAGLSTTLPEFVVPVRRQAIAASVRFAYTGSDVFSISVATSNSWFPLENVDDRTTFRGFQLSGRFFF